MTETLDAVVVGAGVVGLAIARELALQGREVVVLEANKAFGEETSARNSEVIHAGIYYQKGSLKGRLCVEGRDRLYAYCAAMGVGHQRIGKLIVANKPEERTELFGLFDLAKGCGVDDLREVSLSELREMEPVVEALAAVYSPSTGLIDSHGLMLAYLGEAEAKGASLVLDSKVSDAAVTDQGFRFTTGGSSFTAKTLINSAGHGAQALAGAMQAFPKDKVPPLFLAKGSYFTLKGPSPFKRLVYPVAGPASLGIHVTLDLAGRCRFGPDAEWVEEIDYAVDPARADYFYRAVRLYWPDMPDDCLEPGYSGVRPKITKGGQDVDFIISGPEDHGVAGLVNLFGIESPGLTASLAIATEVARRV